MKFTKEMVNEYADKLLIGLTEEENSLVLKEFNLIDKNIDIINEIAGIEAIEPMTHALDDFSCDFREDISKESVNLESLLMNCDKVSGREIEVPKVVG